MTQRTIPDHFIAIRVSQHVRLSQVVQTIQQRAVEQTPRLRKALVEPETLHITFAVLKIGDDPDLKEKAMLALQSAVQDLRNHLKKYPPPGCGQHPTRQLVLHMHGLGHFRNQVLYVSPCQETQIKLEKIREFVLKHVSNFELTIVDEKKEFRPHVTVAKCSKLPGPFKWKTKIPECVYSDFLDVQIRDITVNEIELCSMKERETGEYYKVLHSEQIEVE